MKPKETLARFAFLAKRGLALEAVVVGGAALGLLECDLSGDARL